MIEFKKRSIYLSDDTWQLIKELAALQRMAASHYVRILLEPVLASLQERYRNQLNDDKSRNDKRFITNI